ncbi:MAG: hypothetical protein JSR24_03485 [Proteobacteria bacterium]|nr:hypothetical protein [Pseudomonadota bacterium]
MGLDVYVGPLARYYAGDWENVAERAARERVAAPPRRKTRDKKESERQRQAVLTWRTTLHASLGDNAPGPLEWEESFDAPYFTGRPGWDGFGALVLWAAYVEHPTMRPPAVLPEDKWDNDPALVRSNAEGFRSRYSHLVRNVELWLPVSFTFTFEGEDVARRRVVVGSSTTLAQQLADLNAATWKVDDREVAIWGRRHPDDKAPLELHARYAFAVMSDLARKAVEHRLPLKLDF